MLCNDEIGNEFWSLFQLSQTVYFASIENNKPRVRPVTMLCLEDRFWILTGTNDSKVAQIRQNPAMELCLPLKYEENSGYIRASGKAIIVTDEDTRKFVAERCEYFKQHWQETNDPNYTLIELEFTEIEYMKPGDYEGKKFKV